MLLSGWKEIANHLRCGVRTSQRWQAEGLPVKRVGAGPRSPVFAYSEQLDRWMKDGDLRHFRHTEGISLNQHSRELVQEMRQSRETLHRKMEDLHKTVTAMQEQQLAFRALHPQGRRKK